MCIKINEKSTLTRAIRVIDSISRTGSGLRFSEISRLLGSPSPSTVNKIPKELTREGVLQKSPDNRYVLGRKTYFWGHSMAAQNTPIQVIRQEMQSIREIYRASVNLFTCTDQTCSAWNATWTRKLLFSTRRAGAGERCDVNQLCMGDCPKFRPSPETGQARPSLLCRGWKQFFNHSAERLESIAGKIRGSGMPI